MAELSRFFRTVWPTASKTVAFTGAANLGAAGTVPIFTVTGVVFIDFVMGYTSELCVSAGAGQYSLGTPSDTDGFWGLTIATSVAAGTWWPGNVACGGVISTVSGGLGIGGANRVAYEEDINLTITADITDGTIVFYARWVPITQGARLVAA